MFYNNIKTERKLMNRFIQYTLYTGLLCVFSFFSHGLGLGEEREVRGPIERVQRYTLYLLVGRVWILCLPFRRVEDGRTGRTDTDYKPVQDAYWNKREISEELYRLVATSPASPWKSTLGFLGHFLRIASHILSNIAEKTRERYTASSVNGLWFR